MYQIVAQLYRAFHCQEKYAQSSHSLWIRAKFSRDGEQFYNLPQGTGKAMQFLRGF